MVLGISPAPKEFQQRGLEGRKVIVDDILVFGWGASDEEAAKDHDKHLTSPL